MFNLKNGGGSFKGTIGECMFKLTNKNVVITKFFNKNKYFTIFNNYFNREQGVFLRRNWYSIDGIELDFLNGRKRIILYEIKTRNKYPKEFHFKSKMTQETHNIYHQAKDLGFISKLVTVWLYDDWNYTVEIKDFDENDYYIDKPKLYDKQASGAYQ